MCQRRLLHKDFFYSVLYKKTLGEERGCLKNFQNFSAQQKLFLASQVGRNPAFMKLGSLSIYID